MSTGVMNYKDWLVSAENAKNEAISNANSIYNTALYGADLQRKASQPTYGATREALAGVGLHRSGYSDYLEDRASDSYRLSENTARQTRDAAISQAKKTYDTAHNQVVQGTYNTFINRIRGVDDEGNLVSEDLNTSEVKKALDDGTLTQPYYDQLVEQLNSTWLYNDLRGYMDEDGLLKAKSDLGFDFISIDDDPMLSPENKAATKKLLTYLYTPYYDPQGYTTDEDAREDIDFDEDGYGEVDVVHMQDGGAIDEVRVQKLDDNVVELERVVEVGAGVPAGQFFYYNDNIYLKHGENVYWKVDKNDKGYQEILLGITIGKTPYNYKLPTDYREVVKYGN